jgi:sulfate transport system ATP-binding protein
VDKGEARIGGISIDLPEYQEADAGPAFAYVRPYDIEINRQRHSPEEIEARIRFIQGAGAVARLELERLDTLEMIEAEMTRERYRELGLAEGEKVFLRPRNMRVFVGDYHI